MNYLVNLLCVLTWLAGIVLAKGGMVIVAAVFPPYAWYLVVEKSMQMIGWV